MRYFIALMTIFFTGCSNSEQIYRKKLERVSFIIHNSTGYLYFSPPEYEGDKPSRKLKFSPEAYDELFEILK